MRRLAVVLLALPLAACHTQANTRGQMWTHYQRVGAIQQAIIAGDLHIAHNNALWVARNRPADLPAAAASHADRMEAAAQAVANAPSLDEAATATARMGAVCGACHSALSRGPQYAHPNEAPLASDTVHTQMTLHLWSLTRMWDGLTGPSDESWTHGALGLNTTPHYQEHIVEGGAPAERMAQQLHALGQRAAMAPAADRPDVYGRFLGTCAGCHAHFRVRLPQASSPY